MTRAMWSATARKTGLSVCTAICRWNRRSASLQIARCSGFSQSRASSIIASSRSISGSGVNRVVASEAIAGSKSARASSSATGLTPKSSASAACRVASTSSAFSATHVPEPWCVSTTPSICSAPSASRSDGRLTANTRASSRSAGSRCPAAHAPRRMRSMIRSEICS